MERLMMCTRGFVILIARFLRKPDRRLSGPAAFLRLSFFSLTNTVETMMGISLKASLVFFLALYRVNQMKFVNLIDFSFKALAIFEKNKQNLLAMDLLLVVQFASMLNDWAGGSLVLVRKIVLIIFQNLFVFFFLFFFQNFSRQTCNAFFVHAV